MSNQAEIAEAFRARHHAGPVLFMPNAWDALSARIFADAGFEALATTSGGVAWALGAPDGEQARWEDVVAVTRRIVVAARGLPVTADIEGGFAETPAALAGNIAEIIGTGVVGVNLEDSHAGVLRDIDDAAARIAAARDAAKQSGIPIVINARCDALRMGDGGGDLRLDDVITRGRRYLDAGADCIFPLGLRDPVQIERLCSVLAAPVNISGRPGLPEIEELGRLGVARITVGTASTLVAMEAIRNLARGLGQPGGFELLSVPFTHGDGQALFQDAGE